MYSEIPLINLISDKQDRLNMILLFIEEYSGWIQHLKSVGMKWGADKELVKAKAHIEKLKKIVINESLFFN
jgi:hypothetical protein